MNRVPKYSKGRNFSEAASELNQVKLFKERIARLAANGGDTNNRLEIQQTIISEIEKGKNEAEIIDLLSKNEKYKKYEQFFHSWITHQMSKVNEKNSEKEKGK